MSLNTLTELSSKDNTMQMTFRSPTNTVGNELKIK